MGRGEEVGVEEGETKRKVPACLHAWTHTHSHLHTQHTPTTTPPDFIANGTVPVLAEQVSTAPREKVIRVALAALHNLCYGRLDTLNAEMISCGLPKTLENLLDRKWCVRARACVCEGRDGYPSTDRPTDGSTDRLIASLSDPRTTATATGRTRSSRRTWTTCTRRCRRTRGNSGACVRAWTGGKWWTNGGRTNRIDRWIAPRALAGCPSSLSSF